jgi:hypothetical protein
VLAAYVLPAAAVWLALGLGLAALPLTWPLLTDTALVAAIGYGGLYGIAELAGRRGLAAPGRRWQVPSSMMINASPRRRLLVWGAILGPGFLTQNPYAGFGLLPLAVAAMRVAGAGACLALAAAIGLAHGTARAAALLRDVKRHEVHTDPLGQLDALLKIVYWRRLDGAALLAVAAAGVAVSAAYF